MPLGERLRTTGYLLIGIADIAITRAKTAAHPFACGHATGEYIDLSPKSTIRAHDHAITNPRTGETVQGTKQIPAITYMDSHGTTHYELFDPFKHGVITDWLEEGELIADANHVHKHGGKNSKGPWEFEGRK